MKDARRRQGAGDDDAGAARATRDPSSPLSYRGEPSSNVGDVAPQVQGGRIVGELACPVFFIGFMGAGKTSVARKLARLVGIVSVDLDAYLERREGRRVREIFAEQGVERFRALETDVLRDLLMMKDPPLVSCGGGVVLQPENRALLSTSGFVVYLQVTADEAASRISDISTRPLFRDLDTARATIEGRLGLYEEVADVIMDTAGKSVGALAREVRSVLEREGILWQRK